MINSLKKTPINRCWHCPRCTPITAAKELGLTVAANSSPLLLFTGSVNGHSPKSFPGDIPRWLPLPSPAFVDAPGFRERENRLLKPTTLKQSFGYTHSYNPRFPNSTAVRWPFRSLTNTIMPVDCLFRVILWDWSVWKKEVIKWDNRYALMAPLSYRESRVHYVLSMDFLLSCTCCCRAHFLPLGKCRVNGKCTWAGGRIIQRELDW